MKKREQQAEKTKQHLVAIAKQIIREEGIHALSSTKLIQRAGISKGGFFHHFSRIEDLYLYMLDEILDMLTAASVPRENESFEAFIARSGTFMSTYLKEAPEETATLFYFISRSCHNPHYRERIETVLKDVFSQWRLQFREFFHADLDARTLDDLVRMTDMFFSGFSLHGLVIDEPDRDGRIAAMYGRMVVGYLGGRTKS